ncbi:CHAT domain-containing protein [Trichocoleus sp. FACHB-90]|uniref:two-partner secretion domain-containing protein n=1 Tax=Cyanophyceae TaxID=3028117 RepID=UPI001684EADC|nr:CHAT domain-containing protein [Trichocoleus sp. FACHB-90]MBD1929955.1 CHAT domain-containing protein [Trichocoleus sp. FACHB-90]
MSTSWRFGYWALWLASSLGLGGVPTFFGDSTLAQIFPDGTLGTDGSVVTPINRQVDRIDGGVVRGTNLFHSFQEFNVGEGREAYFANPSGIENIFSRVTGSDPSDILGTLRVLGNANFFLLNPNGIIFGPIARLDVRGSFVASTASSLVFADDTLFSATNPQTPPLLTINVPVGLQYGGTAGRILVEASSLEVQPSQTLALVGGDVSLNGGSLLAPGGRVELAGVAGAGAVDLTVDGNNLRLSFPNSVARADMSLTNKARVDVTAGGDGSITVNARNLDVLGGSALSAGIRTNLGSVGSQSGNVEINATGAITLTNESFIGNSVQAGAVGKSGDINITAELLSVMNGAAVFTSTLGQGSAGNITIETDESVQLSGNSAGLFAQSSGAGNAGDLRINTKRLVVRDGAQVSTATFGTGQGGSLTVNASEFVELSGISASGQFRSGLLSGTFGAGAAGDLTIATGNLLLQDGAQVSTSTFSTGQGGTLTVNAANAVELIDTLANSQFFSGLFAQSSGAGNAGDLRINTRRLVVRDGAQVSTSTFSTGQGGTLTVNASESVELSGTSADGQFFSGLIAQTFAAGNAEDLRIDTGDLIVRNGARVTVASGNAADARVPAGQVSFLPRIQISSSSQEKGDAGNIEVTARNVLLDSQGAITAATESAEGGNITLRVQDLLLMRHNSQISTTAGTARASGNGGNININAPFIVALPSENSDITANAFQGNGGNIQITAQGIYGFQFRNRLTPLSDITANSEFGVNGTVQINTPGIDPNPGAVNLPEEPVGAEIAQGCQEGGKPASQFVVTGRGGLPPSPGEALSSDAGLADLVTPTKRVVNFRSPGVSISSTLQQGKKLYETSQFTAAVTSWQQAASAFQASGDVLNQAMALSNLSLAYQQLGQWKEATQAITESLNLLQTEPNTHASTERLEILAPSLDIQGHLQLLQGQAETALNTWQQAAAIYAQLGNQTGVAQSQINQSLAMQNLGLYRQTLNTLIKLNPTLQTQPDSMLKATALRILGDVLLVVGDVEELENFLLLFQPSLDGKRLDYLDQTQQLLLLSLTISERLGSSQESGKALLSLGNAARAAYNRAQDAYERLNIPNDKTQAQQQANAAVDYYQQAAAISPLPLTQIQAQLNLLSLLIDSEQWLQNIEPQSATQKKSSLFQAQLDKLPQLLSQINNLPPSRTAIYARINLAQSLTRIQAVNSQRDLRFEITNPPSQISNLKLIEQLGVTSIEQARQLGDRRAEAYALGYLGKLYEQNKRLSQAQDLTQKALWLTQNIQAPDIAYQWQWQLGRIFRNQGKIGDAIAAYDETIKTLVSIRGDLLSLNNPNFQFSFRDNVEPVYRELVDLLLLSKDNRTPQENLQKARNVIEYLEVAELENYLQCRLPDANSIDQVIHDNPKAAAIYTIILEDRLEVILKLPQQNDLIHYTTFVSRSELEKTVEQLRENIEERKIGRDNTSRFQKVYDWLLRPAEPYLGNQVETLVFVLDGSLRNIPLAALYDGKQYLVEKYSVALNLGLQLLDGKPLKQGRQLKVLLAGLSESVQYFPALPYVENELEQIKSKLPNSKVLLNSQFTTQALQYQINSQPFSVIHLATHGVFSSNPEQTFILAYEQPIKVNQLSKLLKSREENRPEPIELLVLSACQTASGDKRTVLGIASIALRAGARSTLASLLSVNDASTAMLMSQFYQELINSAPTKAEALRRAQLALLKQEEYRSPYYWASYVLVGNWR